MSARFQQDEKVEVERQRRNSFPRQGASSEAQVLRTAGRIPSGPYAFLVLSSERAEMTSLEEIIILGINELEGVEGGGIAPESSKVELEAKVRAKSSALVEGKMAVVPSEETRGGKEEEAKLELTFFAKCQKRREEEEPERLLHFLRRKEFLVLRRIDFAGFRDEI